jgi:hypothetical protein
VRVKKTFDEKGAIIQAKADAEKAGMTKKIQEIFNRTSNAKTVLKINKLISLEKKLINTTDETKKNELKKQVDDLREIIEKEIEAT